MIAFVKYPRRCAAVAIVGLLCAVLAFAGCATNPADDAATQAAIADAVAATVAAQRPTLAPPPTPISIAAAATAMPTLASPATFAPSPDVPATVRRS